MPTPTLIDYPTFLANAQEADLRALSLLSAGELIKTQDAAEADVFEAQGVRLWDAGCLSRFRRSIEDIGGDTWHVFDARVRTGAMIYVADCAKERVMLSREPLPTA